MRVISQAERYVKDNHIEKGQIWCVYDKDSLRILITTECRAMDTSGNRTTLEGVKKAFDMIHHMIYIRNIREVVSCRKQQLCR